MNSYNGFKPQERTKAQSWLRKEWASGNLKKPDTCCACGNHGIVDAHAEDYSEPFGPHLQEYPLCFVCHMMVHCRFKNEAAWDKYRELIRDGAVFKPFQTRNFYLFKKMFLESDFERFIQGKVKRDYFPLDIINGR